MTLSTSGSEESYEKEILWKQGLIHVMSMRDCDKTQMRAHGKHGTH